MHGPNLNLLGKREPEIYGRTTLYRLNRMLEELGEKLGLDVVTYQSNSEGELVEAVHAARGRFDFIIINPGALTHTSIALRDALLAAEVPFIEVHLSNVFAREEMRKRSTLSDVAKGVISGFGVHSYIMALRFVAGADGETK